MSVRGYTVKMAPVEGMSRVQLVGLVPEDFLVWKDFNRIVEVEVRSVVAGDWSAAVMLSISDGPRGYYVGRSYYKTVCRMSTVAEARVGWNVIVSFEEIPGMPNHRPLLQRADTDYHVVVRVSSRPA